MPAYCYQCKCGEQFTKVMPVAKCKKRVRCPKCKSGAARDFMAEHGSTFHKAGNWPMVSDSAGVHPDQIKEVMAHADQIGVPTQFNKLGQAIFTSARHRKQYCEAVGLHDRNGGYSDPQRR